MKIFSNFDTQLAKRLLQEAQEKYGNESVLCVRRGEVYLFIRLFLPTALWLFVTVTLLLVYYFYIGFTTTFGRYVGFFVWGLVLSSGIYLLYYASIKIMNYYMDFVIITPDQITAYDQDGILVRTTRSLELRKIKTINVVGEGRMSSVFNYGCIIFLAEGDLLHGDIKLSYIVDPVNLRDTIYDLIERRIEQQIIPIMPTDEHTQEYG